VRDTRYLPALRILYLQGGKIMMPGLVFGVLGGIAIARFISRRRRWAHGYGGGCGGRWHRGYRHDHDEFDAPRGGFRVGRRPTVWLARELELDDVQQGEVEKIWRLARGAVGRFGMARFAVLGQLAGALGDEVFDRPRIDSILAQSRALESVRQQIGDALERLHLTLSPEQRERLKDLAGGRPHDQPPTVA
jgi:hypothetical protein